MDPKRIFAAGAMYASGGARHMALYKTEDGGLSWARLIVSPAEGGLGQAVAVNPANDQVVYIGGQSESQTLLYVSTNGGSSWTQIAKDLFSPNETLRAIVVEPAWPGRVFAGTIKGLYRSDDGGSTWAKTGDFAVSGIRFNVHATNEIWASSSDGGMYFSNDRGGSWTPVNDGLETLCVNALGWSPSVGMVYAATASGGIFRRGPLDLSERVFLTINATAGGTTIPAPGMYAHPPGAVVTVTATPQANCRFAGWTGDATGMVNPLTLTMTKDTSVKANFQRLIYAPANFTGAKKVNRGVFVSEYINALTWQANANNVNITKYRLYIQSGAAFYLLAELDPAALEYRHRGVKADGVYTYMIRAVNNEPREGEVATVTIR